MYLISGHYRQPLAFSPSELADADRRVLRVRDALRRLRGGRGQPAGHGAAQGCLLRGAGQRLQHADGARRAVRVGSRGQPARRGRRRRATCARCSRRSAWRPEPARGLRATRGASTRRRCSCWLQREQARAARDFARADEIREQLRALELGDPRRPAGPGARPDRRTVIVYGRNPVREALRGKRAKQVREVWATARAAASRGWPTWRRAGRRGRGDRAALRVCRAPGRVRGCRPLSVCLGRARCSPAPSR